ncbi:MAG: MarR family EPS-associated transcriptional regulator [Desulfobacterales bacterium]|nr:MarR family EPS-associated transcriptional regulator [Desulfobacterales bacterium]
MALSKKDFKVLDALDCEPITTQRQLSEHTGISLGQINYVLRRLLEKGMVKVSNFRKNPNKFSYVYKLTPTGIEAKSRLAVNFVVSRLREYYTLQRRLSRRLQEIEQKGAVDIVFVGPAIVNEFVETTIFEADLKLQLVAHLTAAGKLATLADIAFDTVLLFDENVEGLQQISTETGIAFEKLVLLW